jgi:PIN domain nuclease of toxin-antitoxin system
VKLLLDTHCLIWLLTDAPELDAASRRAVAQADSVWFSDASIWELGLKWRKGKIAVQPRRIAEQALANGLTPLPMVREALLLSSELHTEHGDPFDRLLFAQARHGGYRLLSIDRQLQALGAVVLRP